eukprot:TRINITY_DN662_c1_g2_i6.p1 TRINITY_DN662_c1_g2~~TRINITY_DN662_c1_g2_i6.p1  ORF type:complete len:314 (+),score=81.52 TRINITY_DN662_c1_g2_i6:131-1072(+)
MGNRSSNEGKGVLSSISRRKPSSRKGSLEKEKQILVAGLRATGKSSVLQAIHNFELKQTRSTHSKTNQLVSPSLSCPSKPGQGLSEGQPRLQPSKTTHFTPFRPPQLPPLQLPKISASAPSSPSTSSSTLSPTSTSTSTYSSQLSPSRDCSDYSGTSPPTSARNLSPSSAPFFTSGSFNCIGALSNVDRVEKLQRGKERLWFWETAEGQDLPVARRHAFVYVIDMSSDKDSLVVAALEFKRLTAKKSDQCLPVLLLLNKMDKDTNTISANDVKERFELGTDKTWRMQSCSAVTGDGLIEGLDWLINQLKDGDM